MTGVATLTYLNPKHIPTHISGVVAVVMDGYLSTKSVLVIRVSHPSTTGEACYLQVFSVSTSIITIESDSINMVCVLQLV